MWIEFTPRTKIQIMVYHFDPLRGWKIAAQSRVSWAFTGWGQRLVAFTFIKYLEQRKGNDRKYRLDISLAGRVDSILSAGAEVWACLTTIPPTFTFSVATRVLRYLTKTSWLTRGERNNKKTTSRPIEGSKGLPSKASTRIVFSVLKYQMY